MESKLRYQDLRGLVRSLSSLLPRIRSQVHLTSAAVKGLPSCQLTLCRSSKVSAVISAFHDHLVARSGSIVSIRFCATSCLKRTKLLKTAIIGFWAELNASSWIDMLAGLSYWNTRSTPPCFCADADSIGLSGEVAGRSKKAIPLAMIIATTIAPKMMPIASFRRIMCSSCSLDVRRVTHRFRRKELSIEDSRGLGNFLNKQHSTNLLSRRSPSTGRLLLVRDPRRHQPIQQHLRDGDRRTLDR